MTKTKKSAEGERLKSFFQETLASDPSVDPKMAEQLAARGVDSIDKVLTAQGIEAGLDEVVDPSGFDPFAFSVVAVLTKSGPEALLRQLARISEPAHLRKIAEAQHIAIDPKLDDLDELCLAIVRGAQRRIAARRAAAS